MFTKKDVNNEAKAKIITRLSLACDKINCSGRGSDIKNKLTGA